MSAPLPPRALTRQLVALLPGAELLNSKSRAWSSATFTGERLTIALRLNGDQAESRADDFARTLPETEFALPKGFVADIVVSEIAPCAGGVELTIEALWLDD